MINKHIIVVEATTSGAGLNILKSALKNGYSVSFLAKNLSKYIKFDDDKLFEKIEVIECNTTDEEVISEKVQTINENKKLVGLLTLTDGNIEVVSRVCKKLGLRTMNPEAVEKSRNKEQTRALSEKIEIKIPKYQVINDINDALKFTSSIGYPVILKTTRGTGSINVLLCNNDEDLKKSFHKISLNNNDINSSILIEEFLIGPLVSVESITYNGQTTCLGITDRVLGSLPYFVETSYSFPIKVGEKLEEQLVSMTKKIIKELNVDYGATHIEYILTKDGPALVEVNPRLGGGMLGPMISNSLGIDIYEILIKIFTDEEVNLSFVPQMGCSTKVLYSDRVGIVKSVDYSLALNSPGIKDIVLSVKEGDEVSTPEDFKGDLGYIWAQGETVELATLNCQTAANYILVDIKKTVQPLINT